MTKANSISIRRTAVLAAIPIVALTGLSIPATLAFAPQSTGPIGDFTVKYDELSSESGKGDALTIDVTNATMTSARYDMSGNTIQFIVKNTGKSNTVDTATASGNVLVVARAQDGSQTTTMTCDNARYSRSAPNTTNGRIDMTGHVRTKTYVSGNPTPFISESESGYVEFLEGSSYKVRMVHGTAGGTFAEPTPNPAAPKK